MGQTTVRKGRGNSTVSKSIFCVVFFFSTYTIILGIHTYILHNSECDFLKYFFWGDNPRMGGDMSPPSPPGFTPMENVTLDRQTVRCAIKILFIKHLKAL